MLKNVLFTLLRIVPQLELIALWNIFTYEYLGETKKTLLFYVYWKLQQHFWACG